MPVGRSKLWFAAALLLPVLMIFNTGPYPSAYNQSLAIILWGGVVAFGMPGPPQRMRIHCASVWPQLAAVCLLAFSTISSLLSTGLPASMAVNVLAFLACVVVVSASAGQKFSSETAPSAGRHFAFIAAVALTAVASCGPAAVQIFAPDLIDRSWLEIAWGPDRISGNVRQPNLLATLLAWGIAATIAISELRRFPQYLQLPASCLMLFVIAATGSRVGALEVFALAVWGLIDRKLSFPNRANLLFAPIVLAVSWMGLRYWASLSGVDHGRAPDFSSGRYEMWRQCLSLIAAHPFGVGLGNFNFAWTLTPFDRSNPETFDHAHNLILQWAVELGIPITLTLIGLLGWSLWSGLHKMRRSSGEESIVRRFCLVFIVLVLIHSMTEYPLWYAYFLLPAAFAWGVVSAPRCSADATSCLLKPVKEAHTTVDWLGTCGLLMALGAAFAMYDYQKIVTIYHPWDGAPPIEERVAAGRKAILYGHLADRFAGTLAVKGTRRLEPYKTATRQLLDMRLLIAWSLAMEEAGHLDKARYLAQRVKDFNDPVAQQFFNACKSQKAGAAMPWQCTPPAGRYTYEDFL